MSQQKSTYKNTLQLIAEILSFKTSNIDLRKKLQSNEVDWEHFVKLSSEQLVMTTCYCRLEQRQLLDAIPEDLEFYLKDLTSINRNRNLKLIIEIQDITQAFNKNNIDYVLLKGAALLMGDFFKDLGERMTGDVDILVSTVDIDKAYQLIKKLGYNQSKGFNYNITNFRHLPRQFTDGKLAVIELHKSVLDSKFKHIINNDLIFKNKLEYKDVFIPNIYFLNIINVMALQVNSSGYRYRHWFLRNMYDSLVLKLDLQTDLLLDYRDNTYFIDYLSKCLAIFKPLQFKTINEKIKRKKSYYNFKLNNFWFHQTVYKSKYVFYGIYDRILLFFNNSSYRSHSVKRLFSKSK